jgi:phage-related minor tail protein
MASGMGLMGEAGPEAIMPLKRTASGQLGVQVADGDKAGGPVIINVAGGTKIMTPADQAGMAVKAIDDYLKETGDRLPSGRVINFQT